VTTAKYQHYVPQLHLRRFLGDAPKGMIWTYDKLQASRRPLKPENTGGQTYFYSLPMKDGSRNDTIDRFLQDIESAAEPAYSALLQGSIPVADDRSHFAIFLATLHLRSPGMIRCMAELHGKALATQVNAECSTYERYEQFLDRMDAALGTVTLNRREAYDFWKDTSRYSIAVDRTEGLRALESAGDIAEILYGRHWYVLDAAQGYFVTSDQPVERSTPGRGEGAFTNPYTEVSFPLSPSRCLLITGSWLGRDRHVVGASAVTRLNDMRARYAERLIWSHQKSDAVSALAERHKQNRLEMRFSNQEDLPDIDVERPRFGTKRTID
jgi:hypothetical protein